MKTRAGSKSAFSRRPTRSIAGCALGVLLAICLSATAAQGQGIFPYPTHLQTLDNGLQVIIVPMNSSGLVSYWSIVRTGSRDEYEPGRTGFAHFFEHMMFRGTEKYPAEVYNNIVNELGANSNAFTTDDLTAYYLDFGREDLERVIDIESDRFMNLSYPKKMFETEAGAVYGEYRKNRMSPFFVIFEEIRQAAFDQHTYGHTTMGYEKDIKIMPELFDYSQTFFDRYYRPENILLVIAGDVDPESTLELVRKYYGSWEPGYVAPKVEAEPAQDGLRTTEVTYPGRTLPYLWISHKSDAFDATSVEFAAADLATRLLFGESSPLYRQLVLEDQSVQMLTAQHAINRDPGTNDIIAIIKDPAKIDDVRASIEAAITEAQETPPDAERLAQLKSRLRYEFLMSLATPNDIGSNLVRLLAVGGNFEAVNALHATYGEVTPDDVLNAARKYLVPERRTVAVLKGES